ncbi:MAG: hypothetical protein N3A38_13460, partial [Planctomycetota bacterium]|nr:hypothetical protein [Planctomycetota bacterium]
LNGDLQEISLQLEDMHQRQMMGLKIIKAQEEERQRVMPAWQQEIMRRMARKVSFDFVDTPLSEVIAYLTSLTRVNIILDPKAAQEGADKAPITLRVREMELETALRWILRLANLDYDLRNQAVFISSRKHLGSTLELEVYDVRDLTMTIENFPGPRIDLGVAGAGAAVGGAAPAAPAAPPAGGGEVMDAASLAAMIREKLAPNAWAEETGASIQDRGGRLIVMQRPEIHALIKQLLRTFRETQTLQVVVQVRFVDVREAFLEQIGVHLTGLDSPLGDTGVPNAKVDPNPLNQPSRSGLYPMGGGPNTTTTPPSDIQPMLPAWQRPAFPIFAPPITPRGNPGSPVVLHPRLDPNYPRLGSVATVGPALDPVGIRRQQYSKTLGSPMLWMGEVVNLTRGQPLNPTVAPLGPQLVNRPDQGALFQFRYLGPLQVNAILQALKQEQNADQLLAPKLTMFNNQQAHVMVTQQRAYISDYDVSGAVFDPQITSFMTGVVLEVRPTVSHDRRYITLEMKPGTAVEVTPPQIIYITNGGNVNLPQGSINLPIELPNLELRSISTTATVPDGGTLLLSGMIHDEKIDSKTGIPVLADIPVIGRAFSKNYKEIGRRNLVVMVNAHLILFDEEEAKL